MSRQPPSLLNMFLDRARETPEALAIVDGPVLVSYRALEAASRRAAQQFRAQGWQVGQTVGLLGQRYPAALQVIVMLGLERAGVAYLPLTEREAAAESGVALLRHLGAVGMVGDTSGTDLPVLAPDMVWLSADDLPPAADAPLPGDLPCFVGRSSGTTGEPKAFAVTHAQDVARMLSQGEALMMRRQDRVMSLTGFGFVTGLSYAKRCLAAGGTVVARPQAEAAEAAFDRIDRYAVNYVCGTPSHLHSMLDAAPPDAPRLPGLRVLRVGGAVLSQGAITGILGRISPSLVYNYGCNEAGGLTSATGAMLLAHPGTVGSVIPGMQVEVRDAAGAPVAAGQPGRVWVRGAGTVTRYLHGTDADQARFVAGWYDTSDIGVLDAAGLLFLRGRADDMLNYSGMLLSLRDLELAFEDHHAVAEVAAFALPSERHQDLPLVAVVLKGEATTEALLAHGRARLGVRAPVAIFLTRDLPRNGMGKVLRHELAAQARAAMTARPRQE